MRKLFFILTTLTSISLFAQEENKLPPNSAALIYQMPDTLKAVQYYNVLMVDSNSYNKNSLYGSYFSEGIIGLQADKKGKRSIIFKLNNKENNEVKLLAKGLYVDEINAVSVAWKYDWQVGHGYKFLLTIIADSASQSTYYTGYVFLPTEQKWKLLASFKKMNDGKYIKEPGVTASALKPSKKRISRKLFVEQAWVQKENGTWKEFDTCCTVRMHHNIWEASSGNREKNKGIFIENVTSISGPIKNTIDGSYIKIFTTNPRPTIDLTRQVDSLEQLSLDLQEINAAIQSGKIDTTGSKENVYYKILKEGNGDLVNINDTVTAFYKGSLLKDGSVFDETKDKPATFPLKRLIRGWQIAVPLLKIGGKIRIFIPSSLAYSIRSRSKAIPPNSVLVFDVEVVSVKK